MHITDLVQLLERVPNAPFHTRNIEVVVLNLLMQLPKSDYSVEFHNDAYSVGMRIRHADATIKHVWVSHLDHPAIILDKRGNGYPVGSLGGIGIRGVTHIQQGLHSVMVYSPWGDLLFKTVCEVSENTLRLAARHDLPNESIAIWNVGTDISQGVISMRSADNHIPTIIALLAMQKLISQKAVFDVTLVFNTVEEVYQLSMTRHMVRNGIPELHLQFDEDTIFVVLEAMEMLPSTQFESLGLSHPTYEDGLLLKVNDTNVVFGMPSGKNSKVEAILYDVLQKTGRRFQYTASSGTSDATAIAALSQYPNVICLAVPCSNKHNVTEEGLIAAEKVALYDVQTAIEALVQYIHKDEFNAASDLLSNQLKQSGLLDVDGLHEASMVRRRVLKHNAPRIEHRFYLANTIWRKALLAIART